MQLPNGLTLPLTSHSCLPPPHVEIVDDLLQLLPLLSLVLQLRSHLPHLPQHLAEGFSHLVLPTALLAQFLLLIVVLELQLLNLSLALFQFGCHPQRLHLTRADLEGLAELVSRAYLDVGLGGVVEFLQVVVETGQKRTLSCLLLLKGADHGVAGRKTPCAGIDGNAAILGSGHLHEEAFSGVLRLPQSLPLIARPLPHILLLHCHISVRFLAGVEILSGGGFCVALIFGD